MHQNTAGRVECPTVPFYSYAYRLRFQLAEDGRGEGGGIRWCHYSGRMKNDRLAGWGAGTGTWMGTGRGE